ncbi:glycosyltransferase [Cognatishimia activa]|uniref:glycosyltransferase n=1 Tax=Cognatishimia activa TaxID=1715691 RepID=UPI00071D8547|nr:galactosyltransferase-related protein [Cognatishimia activa]
MCHEGDALQVTSATAGDAIAVPPITKDSHPGISLVTCSMNRSENLLKALRSWLPQSEISELIIIDWGSDVPVAETLHKEGIFDPRIRLVRAPDEARWILSYAFNLGFRLAKFDKILKVDADIVLSDDFFDKNTLIEGSFIAGNWREAEQGQEHVNGFFYLHKNDLAEIGGFNEYITTYGWDDDDLYSRLDEIGIKRENVAPSTIKHLDHSDEERSEDILGDVPAFSAIDEIRNDTMFKIRRNRFIANVMPVWNGQGGFIPLPLKQQPLADETIEVRRVGWIDAEVPPHVEDDANFYALGELASWRLGKQVLGLERGQLRSLLRKSFAEIEQQGLKNLLSQDVPTPEISVPRRKLFIDAQHGLGNRLRAIGSGAAVAEKTDRELVIVWEPDAHCEGRLSDLYEYDGAVEEVAFYKDAESRNCQLYNYMEIEDGAVKDAPITLDDGKDLYARAAYVLNSPLSSWEDENRFLQSLTPIEPVRALVDGVRKPNDVSAHVRMVGGSEYEHLAYESLDNWTAEGHAETEKWRKRSHFSHFLKRIDTLIKEGNAERIFLAADKPETYEAFQACYGDRVAYLPRELYDRSAEQLHYALADALLLGSSPLLLGSTWSSFSELAMRLSPQKMTIEMSGKDF